MSIPTVHNLFGKKYDIIRELCGELVTRIDQVLAQPDLLDPVASAEVFIDNLLALYRDEEAFYHTAVHRGRTPGAVRARDVERNLQKVAKNR